MNDLRTTIPGLVAAISTALLPVAPKGWTPWLVIINATALGALGYFAKQTGGKA